MSWILNKIKFLLNHHFFSNYFSLENSFYFSEISFFNKVKIEKLKNGLLWI